MKKDSQHRRIGDALSLRATLFITVGIVIFVTVPNASAVNGVPSPTVMSTGADPAVAQTQAVLKDPHARMKVIGASPDAQQADQFVQSVSKDPADKQKMYDISAEIIPIVAKMADNDPVKMQQILADAQKNPEKFLQSLPAEEQAKIMNLSAEIAKKSPASAKP